MKLNIHSLGVLEYQIAYNMQERLLYDVQSGSEDQLMLLEHPKVITLGLHADERNIRLPKEQLEQLGFQVVKTRRGGDVTYHGPGQLVGYTLFNIKKNHGGSVKKFVNRLEQLFIDLLKEHYCIDAQRNPINSGVFVGNSKILAIGLSVKKGVTMHGFALNVNTHLEDFNTIVPCGLKDFSVTSIQEQCKTLISMEQIQIEVYNAIIKEFGYTPNPNFNPNAL